MVVGVAAVDWAAFATAGGTLLLALATFYLAWLTWRTTRQNNELIQVARDEVVQATEQTKAVAEQARQSSRQADLSAELVQEVRVDRELGWRPWLAIRSYTRPGFTERTMGQQTAGMVSLAASQEDAVRPLDPNMRVTIQNIGRGLALRCQYIGYYSIPEDGAPARGLDPTAGRFVGGRAYYATGAFNLGAGDERSLQANQVPGPSVMAAVDGTDTAHPAAEVNILLCLDQFGRAYRFRSGRALPDTWPPSPPAQVGTGPERPAWVSVVDEWPMLG